MRLFGNLTALRRPFHGIERYLADRMLTAGGFSGASNSLESTIPAGWTYFAQFVNHDLSMKSVLGGRSRSSALNLDSLYGDGPETDDGDSYYHKDNATYGEFRIGQGINPYEKDLLRDAKGVAIIPDARNDESVLVSQVHLGFQLFHNNLLKHVKKICPSFPVAQAFDFTRKMTRWHYQWLVVNRFLPLVADDQVLGEVLPKAEQGTFRYYDLVQGPHVPIEFSLAAFRFGHSMARESYNLNDLKLDIPLFVKPSTGPEDDLRGGRQLPVNWSVQWDMFLQVFPQAGQSPQMAMPIDSQISAVMGHVPVSGASIRLPELTLQRGFDSGLPSGQEVALHLRYPLIDADCNYPLWLYILLESEKSKVGGLGHVGSRIVTEVVLGLLVADAESYVHSKPGFRWQPMPEVMDGAATFDLISVFRFAGLPITRTDVTIRSKRLRDSLGGRRIAAAPPAGSFAEPPGKASVSRPG